MYTNDEIMQHYGVDSWEGVEAQFLDGGSNAGLWGWLYVLQQAQNGDAVTAYGSNLLRAGGPSVTASLGGFFQRSASGVISVALSQFTAGNEQAVYDAGVIVSEGAFAHFGYGSSEQFYRYGTGNPSIYYDSYHPYFHLDLGSLGLAALKAGTGFGPMLMKIPHPAAEAGGALYTAVGWFTTAVTDYLAPLKNGDYYTPAEAATIQVIGAGVERSPAKNASPYIGPAIDTAKSLCWSTGCPR